jgi:putative phage-type endonuclease
MEYKDWIEGRRRGIGGSDLGSILGVNPYKTVQDLWADKMGIAPPTEATGPIRRGRALESIIADEYAATTGRHLIEGPENFSHPGNPVLMANVDRLIKRGNRVEDWGVLEIKAPGFRIFGRCKRQGLPAYWLVQLQHYLGVLGLSWGSFAVFSAEHWALLWFDVERDDSLVEMMQRRCLEFWRYIETETPPPIEAPPAIDIPKNLKGTVSQVDGAEWKAAVESLREAQGLRKEAEAIEAEAKAQVADLMAARGIDAAEGAGCRVYNRQQAGRRTLDKQALVKDYPGLDLGKYMKRGKPTKRFVAYFAE